MILTVHFLRPIANLSNETSAVEVEIESSEFLLYRRVPQNCTQNKTKNLDSLINRSNSHSKMKLILYEKRSLV